MTDRSTLVRLRAEVADYVGGMRKAKKETQDLSREVKSAGQTSTEASRVHEVSATRTARAQGVVTKAHGKAQAAAAKWGSATGLAAGIAGAAIVHMAHDAVDAYSGLSEQISATKTLFGAAADEMLRFGEGAEAIGLSERAALTAGNAFGDFFLKIGYAEDAAATVSEDLVRMAADFASFKDLDPGDVLDKLKSGLSGESEPLRALGVFLNEAQVKAEGMRLGLADAHGEMTDGAKISARYSLIIKSMGKAYGDVSRTADSYANQQRRFAAQTENLKAEAGKALLPVFSEYQYVLGKTAGALNSLGKESEGTSSKILNSLNPVHYIAEGLRFFGDEADDTAGDVEYLADSQKILANANKYTKTQVQAATQSLQEQQKALDELVRATTAQFSSEVAAQRAVLNIADSLKDYNHSLALNKDKKKDNDVSTNDLKNKQLDLRDALLNAASAAVQQAEDNAKAAGKTLTESEKYDLFKQALIKLRQQFPQLRGDIDRYIAQLRQVPPTVDTKVTVTEADTVISRLKAIDYLMGTLDGKKATVTVTSSTDDLLLPPSLGAPDRPTGKGHAGGGWISGPGTGTSDSIAARLSNGEFVVNARSAQQNAVLLEAINARGFAAGGWVAGRPVATGGMSATLAEQLIAAVRDARPLVLQASGRDLSERELIEEAVFANRAGRLS